MNLCFLPNDGRKYIIIKLTIIEGLVEYFKSCLFVYHDIPITFSFIAANRKGNLEYLNYIENHLKHELPLYPIFVYLAFYLIVYYICSVITSLLFVKLYSKILLFFYYYIKEALIIIFSPISFITIPILNAFKSTIYHILYYITKLVINPVISALRFLFNTFVLSPIIEIVEKTREFFYDITFLLDHIFIPILTYFILSDPLLALQYISLLFEFIHIKVFDFTYRAYYEFFGYGRCIECNLLFKDKNLWCKYCHSKRFQDNFSKWDSGDETVNDIIRKAQLNAEKACQLIEWIPYDDFENIVYIARGGFSRVYRANWIHGQILSRNYCDHDYIRNKNMLVALKELNNSSNIYDNFLNEVK